MSTIKPEYDDNYNFEESNYRTKRAISNRIDKVLNVLERQKVLCLPKTSEKLSARKVKEMILKNKPYLYPQIKQCKRSEDYDFRLQQCIKMRETDRDKRSRVNQTEKKTSPKQTDNTSPKNTTRKKSPNQTEEKFSPEGSATPPEYKTEYGYGCKTCKFGVFRTPPIGKTRKELNRHLLSDTHHKKLAKEKLSRDLPSPQKYGCDICGYTVKFDENKLTMKNRLIRHMNGKTHKDNVAKFEEEKKKKNVTRNPEQTEKKTSAKNTTAKNTNEIRRAQSVTTIAKVIRGRNTRKNIKRTRNTSANQTVPTEKKTKPPGPPKSKTPSPQETKTTVTQQNDLPVTQQNDLPVTQQNELQVTQQIESPIVSPQVSPGSQD